MFYSQNSVSYRNRSINHCLSVLLRSDPALNSHQRISVIHKRIQDLRKTYNHLKGELASIDRRRKKLRRRDRETKKLKQRQIDCGGAAWSRVQRPFGKDNN